MKERGVQILRNHWAFNRSIVVNWSIVIKSEIKCCNSIGTHVKVKSPARFKNDCSDHIHVLEHAVLKIGKNNALRSQ